MEKKFERSHPDLEALHHKFRVGPCFVCEVVADAGETPRHVVYEDSEHVAFLDGYPRAYGCTLVAPKEHREQVTADFSLEEYLNLQQIIYRVTEAVREEVGAERMYVFAFGSNQGNAHAHWHVVPLSPGVPYEEQQGARTSWRKGVLKIPEGEMDSLASRIGGRV